MCFFYRALWACGHTVESLISIHLEWYSRVFVWTVYTSVLCAEGSHLHNCTYIYTTRKLIRSMRRTGQSWHGGKWRSGQSTSWPVCSRDTAALATSLKTTTRFQSGTSRRSQVSYCPHLLLTVAGIRRMLQVPFTCIRPSDLIYFCLYTAQSLCFMCEFCGK